MFRFSKYGVTVSQTRVSGYVLSISFQTRVPIPLPCAEGLINSKSSLLCRVSSSITSTTPPTFCPFSSMWNAAAPSAHAEDRGGAQGIRGRLFARGKAGDPHPHRNAARSFDKSGVRRMVMRIAPFRSVSACGDASVCSPKRPEPGQIGTAPDSLAKKYHLPLQIKALQDRRHKTPCGPFPRTARGV